jgi:hypothetical protein
MRDPLPDSSTRLAAMTEAFVHELEERLACVETWFGRYGALALAFLSILLGVGAFLGWAILGDRVGPWARVSLGALGAASLAFVGWHVRSHRSARFGNVLLALALALFQVDIWGAGPRLQLLPDSVSLTLAAVASAVLAWLALRERDATLFNVGFGSALLAPFVTADVVHAETSWLLLGYGLIVLSAGLVATRSKIRSELPLLFVVGSWVYLGWTTVATQEASLRFALAPGVFALVCSWLALALVAGVLGARTALAVLLMAPVFLAGRVFEIDSSTRYSVLAAAIAFSALSAARRDVETRRTLFVGAILIPASTLWLALVPLEGEHKVLQALAAVGWAAMSVALTWRLPARARDAGLVSAFLCAGAVCPIVLDERSVGLTIALSGYGACAAFAMAWLERPGVALAIVVWLAVATVVGYGELAERPPYEYMPFMTAPSFGALTYSLAWILTFYLVRRLLKYGADRAMSADDVVGIGAAIAIFFWGRQELSAAFSPDAAALGLIAYYALLGVSLIYVGQLRESLHLRPLGLALSIYAAVKAVFEAAQLEVGFRVAGFLLSGLFLLAVAYWYQQPTYPTDTIEPDGHAQRTG